MKLLALHYPWLILIFFPLVISGFFLVYANKKKSERIKLLAMKSRKVLSLPIVLYPWRSCRSLPAWLFTRNTWGTWPKHRFPDPTPGDQESLGPGRGPGTYISTRTPDDADECPPVFENY